MIRITVLTVGKLKEKYLREGCDEYLKRLSAFSKVQVVELPESRCPADPSPAEIQRVLEQEGDSILAKIPKGARVIPLCIEGQELSSAQLAARVADFSQQSSPPGICHRRFVWPVASCKGRRRLAAVLW